MANSKRRCTICDAYFPTAGFYCLRPAVCSAVCFKDRSERRRQKRRVGASRNVRAGSTLGSDIRTRVRTRDNNVCRWCGTSEGLQLHHIEYRSQGGRDEDHNLITLCLVHHVVVHTDKGHYAPLCRGYIWLAYAGEMTTLPALERRLLNVGGTGRSVAGRS